MFLGIIISIIAISFLIILHELGHYLVAKKFNVKVEEFGLGLPPRLYGKKIGETIWSLNWIPFGGFVRMYGENSEVNDKKNPKDINRAFNKKPVWQRMLITVAGCLAFWLVAFFIFIFIFSIGTIIPINDDQRVDGAQVIIPLIEKNSLAYKVNIQPGDVVKKVAIIINEEETTKIQINKIKNLQNIIRDNPGQEIILYIKRGEEIKLKNIKLQEENPVIGVRLERVAFQSFPIGQSIKKSITATYNTTVFIAQGSFEAIRNLITRDDTVEIVGPIIMIKIMGGRLETGITPFLRILALITINLAILNLLPIPGLDGGRLVFLAYEGVKRKPFPQKIETYLTAFFLISLLGLMLVVTIGEIRDIVIYLKSLLN